MKYALAIVFLFACLAGASAETLTGTAEAAISAYRRQHGLPAVKADAALMGLAHQQVQSMARAGVLSHTVGGSFQSRVSHAGGNIAAENIAAGTGDFSSTLEVWKRSSGHRANLLKRGVARIGIASAPAPQSKYKVFWALILAGTIERHPALRAARVRRASIRRPGAPDPIKFCGESIAGMARIRCE
jgi:hypothetical protein